MRIQVFAATCSANDRTGASARAERVLHHFEAFVRGRHIDATLAPTVPELPSGVAFAQCRNGLRVVSAYDLGLDDFVVRVDATLDVLSLPGLRAIVDALQEPFTVDGEQLIDIGWCVVGDKTHLPSIRRTLKPSAGRGR